MHDPQHAFAIFDAAVAGVAADVPVAAAVAQLRLADKQRVWLFAFGKAAHPMAAGAVEGLGRAMVGLAGGLIVAPAPAPSPHPTLDVMTGEHPIPGRGSFAAAGRLGELARRMRSSDAVIVLVSGGATSIIAAPVPGVTGTELADLYARLLERGLPIAEMNAIRKRFSRWGGGRLAVAVAPASTWCFAVSDVVGDDIAAIGSGPCAPDPSTAPEVQQMLEHAGLAAHLPESMRTILERTSRGLHAETPKPRHPAFAHVSSRIVLANADALAAAAARARLLGLDAEIVGSPLEGEAAEQGDRIGRLLIDRRRSMLPGARVCMVWGGEPTVTLVPPAPPRNSSGRSLPASPPIVPPGGRCQELALSAARALARSGDAADGILLLAAGTDGRDGNTDAAGAIVDRSTWAAIEDAGRDPAQSLARHEAHEALAAAGALVRTGATGTNVMDIVIGIVER